MALQILAIQGVIMKRILLIFVLGLYNSTATPESRPGQPLPESEPILVIEAPRRNSKPSLGAGVLPEQSASDSTATNSAPAIAAAAQTPPANKQSVTIKRVRKPNKSRKVGIKKLNKIKVKKSHKKVTRKPRVSQVTAIGFKKTGTSKKSGTKKTGSRQAKSNGQRLPTPHKVISTYPPIITQVTEKQHTVPICTFLQELGDDNIESQQVLAGIENFLGKDLGKDKIFAKSVGNQVINFSFEHKNHEKSLNTLSSDEMLNLITKSPINIGLVGTDSFLTFEPFIKQKKMLILFPTSICPKLRHRIYENIIYFRPSYERELEALVHYATKVQHKDTFAILHEASLWGNSTATTLKTIFKNLGITPVTVQTYPQGTVDIDQALNKIAKLSPNAIFCLTKPRPAYTFISNAINSGLHECLFLGLSNLYVIQKQLKETRGLDVVVTSVVPQVSKNATLPIIKNYSRAMQAFLTYRDDSPFYLESFIGIALLEYCIIASESPVSITSIIKFLEKLHDFDFQGIKLTFNKNDRSLSSTLWINPGTGKPWINVST